ncbi:hypothetical protein WL92_03190 [Burkholderia multivorans]|nr:hypothetical protein WL91_19945 [Burkholderia multivorans]KWF73038.1 hypothetical protein WL92_03190 [Burkholderia multivorans]
MAKRAAINDKAARRRSAWAALCAEVVPSRSALPLLRVSRRAVIATGAMTVLMLFPLTAFPVAMAVPVAVAVPADDDDGCRCDDDRRGRADVDVDVDSVGKTGQRKAEAGEGKGDQ